MVAPDVAATNVVYFCAGFLTCYLLTTWRIPMSPTTRVDRTWDRVVRASLLVAAGLLLFGGGLYVGVQAARSEFACVDQYANDLADSLEPRQAAAEALDAADRERDLALEAAFEPGNDEADRTRLERANALKIARRNQLVAERKKNPYPDPPREVCAE